MSSFIISDHQLFVQRRDLLPGVNVDAVRLQFFRYGLQDLALPYRFWIVSPGCRARRVILVIFVPTATSSIMVIRTLGFPATLTRLFGFSSLEYWCWYSCRCGMIVLVVACVHVALALRLRKKKGEPLSLFTGLWFDICAIIFWPASGKYKIVSWKKKSLKASKISSFFLGLYFIIAEDSLYISTMYCSLL
jgi:hypothetical protein